MPSGAGQFSFAACALQPVDVRRLLGRKHRDAALLRLIQGIGGAAVRITTMAIVRDCFGGRDMARVMSYVMIVFMIVPIVAPDTWPKW